MEDAPQLLRISKSACPDIWIQWFLLTEICTNTICWTLVGFEEVLLEL